ncbi:hypothetical protein Tco_0419282 [Tanacetum coccineum]
MMNLTTLPKSFWGYVLESAARILNMVPTKKVERTPYGTRKLPIVLLKGLGLIPKGNDGLLLLLSTQEQIFVARNVEFFENSLMIQEASRSHGLLKLSGSDGVLELIQEKDTQPFENTTNWNLPFELMCDAIDFAVGAVLVIFSNGGSSVSDLDLEFSWEVIVMNLSNLEKISSSRRVHLMERRILLPSVDIKDHSFSSNSKIELFLFNSNNCISSVKKRSSQDEGNFAVFFHFENNEISRKGLRALRDSFAYKEYGIRLMLTPRLAKALQEKVLLKLHGIRKLSGSLSFGGTLFWIIAELSSLRKAA